MPHAHRFTNLHWLVLIIANFNPEVCISGNEEHHHTNSQLCQLQYFVTDVLSTYQYTSCLLFVIDEHTKHSPIKHVEQNLCDVKSLSLALSL